jgi:hypothetical protein
MFKLPKVSSDSSVAKTTDVPRSVDQEFLTDTPRVFFVPAISKFCTDLFPLFLDGGSVQIPAAQSMINNECWSDL